MTNFALVYIVQQFFLRIWDFLYHWYAEGTRAIWHRFLKIFFQWDQTFALRVTIRHLFEPLYKDYTVIGWILGPTFRVGRIIIAAAAYAFLIAIFAALMAAWLALPAFLVVKIVRPTAF